MNQDFTSRLSDLRRYAAPPAPAVEVVQQVMQRIEQAPPSETADRWALGVLAVCTATTAALLVAAWSSWPAADVPTIAIFRELMHSLS